MKSLKRRIQELEGIEKRPEYTVPDNFFEGMSSEEIEAYMEEKYKDCPINAQIESWSDDEIMEFIVKDVAETRRMNRSMRG